MICRHEEQKNSEVCEEAHCAALSLLQSVFSSGQQDDTPQEETAIPVGLRTCLVSMHKGSAIQIDLYISVLYSSFHIHLITFPIDTFWRNW